jgi:ABC-type multidrug transport system fused ATPase/permease subunit
MSIVNLLQTWVSVQRLEAFFEEPEVEPWVSALRSEGAASSPSTGSGVGIDNGTFVYDEEAKAGETKPVPTEGDEVSTEEEPKFELRDVTVDFPEGKLSLVCGATGSGKSSLFLALLGGLSSSFLFFSSRLRIPSLSSLPHTD